MSLPFILGGPVVRRADADGVWFWLACREEVTTVGARITAYDSHGQIYENLAGDHGWMFLARAPEVRVTRLGEHLWIALVHVVPARGFTRGWFYGYELTIGSAHFSTTVSGQQLALTYPPFPLPTFVVDGDAHRLAHGSCRRPGADGADAYPAFDAWLRGPIADSSKRPSGLILTGDQIYADEVAAPLFSAVQRLALDLFGYVEQIPTRDGRGTVAVDRYAPGAARGPLTRKGLTALPGSPIGFTTDVGDRHLLSFPEFAAMYLLVHNEQLCRDYRVDDAGTPNLAGFPAAAAASRRVLANVATYMLLDDHEITDDWNLDADWVHATDNPTARRIIANGLAAYWAFQAWGNDPEQFEALKPALVAHLDALRAGRGLPGAPAAAFDRALHERQWSFVAPTKPPALCVDTRTRREFPPGHTAVLSGQRVWPYLTALAERHHLRRGDPLLIVLPTPLLLHRAAAWAQQHDHPWPEHRYDRDYELYINNPVQRADLIRFLRRQFDPPAVIVFSGDVHHGFVIDGLYAGGPNRAAIDAGRGTWGIRVAQVTSSPIKNVKSDAFVDKQWHITDAGNLGESLLPMYETLYDEPKGREAVGVRADAVDLHGPLGRRTFVWENHLCVVDIPETSLRDLEVTFIGGTAARVQTATTSLSLAHDPHAFRPAPPPPTPVLMPMSTAAATRSPVLTLPTGARQMSTYMQTAIEDSLQDAGAPATTPSPCDAAPRLPQVLDACAARLATLVHDVGATGSVAHAARARVRRDSGFDVAPGAHPPAVYNPYVNVARPVLEAVLRAARTAHQPPEILMAIWQREGSLRMPLTPWPVPQATTAARARSIARSDLYWNVLGTDRFTAARPNPHGGENIYDNSDASAADHDRRFHAAIAELVRSGQLGADLSGLIDAELTVAPRAGGGFQVTPTLCFFALSLLLIDAFFTKLWASHFPEAATYGPMLNYQQWNQGTFPAFLRSAERHRAEAAYRRPDGSAPTLEDWAYHTTIKAEEYAQPRRNAIRFGYFVDCFAPIFAPSLAEIRPGRRAAAQEAATLADEIEGYVYDATATACATAARPGATALLHELQGRFRGRSDGIFNCRPVRGATRLSLHGEGRAVDWHLSAADGTEAGEAQAIIDWLLGADADGNADALARRMGVQEIIWNHRIWTARRHAEGFRAYGGVNPHTDHLHIGLSRAGAELHTSYWRAHPPTPPATAPAAQALTLSGDTLQWSGSTPEQLAFMHRVYDGQVARSGRVRAFVADLPASELAVVEGGVRARTETAAACHDLLAAARAALAAAKDAHDAHAATVERVSLVSGYRSASQQLHNWQAGFPTYYRETADQRRAAPGGEHGEQAAELTVRYVGARLGAPGFSLHNNGLAVDLGTREAGHDLGASTSRTSVARWRASWLFAWLQDHAQAFGFRQNTHIDEPWHWEFTGRPAGAPSGQQGFAAGFAAVAARDRMLVDDLPLLRDHHDVNPDLILRWNAMPAVPERIDVVVHLHGFSGVHHLNLAAHKLPVSGLDFAAPTPLPEGARPLPAFAGRTRPTLCVLPRGKCAAQPNRYGIWPYRFPAITRPAGFQSLLNEAIARFATEIGAAGPMPIGRLIITAHSGGGAPLNDILSFTHTLGLDPHEVHVFDAFYGPTDHVESWLARRLGADAQRLAAGVPDPLRYEREDGGALRVLFRDGEGTATGSRRVEQAASRLIPSGVAHATALRDRYGVQPTTVGHTLIPYWYGGRLLADAAASIPAR